MFRRGTISHPGWSDCTIPSTYDIYDSGLNYVNLTPTTREIIGFGLCATVGGGFGYKSTGSATETLTGEDTDADAIALGDVLPALRQIAAQQRS